ncbi:MAG: signal recognition particle-docking protein FtsY [Verrucomicrobiota bacterium]
MIGNIKQWLAEARGGKIDWDELEATLIQSDLGLELSTRILDTLQEQTLSAETVQQALERELKDLWPSPEKTLDKAIAQATVDNPLVLLIVGINGSGKTTTIAKLAHRFQRSKKNVFLVGGDTFRAAALEQLNTWANRLECGIHLGSENGDPAAAAFQGLASARDHKAEVVLIDTAGRLHNNTNLVRELEKVKRVIGKQTPGAPHETILVVDGTNGSNAIQQATEFHSRLSLSGLIVTKLDSSSKGGAVAAIQAELNLPTLFFGNGESLEDLHPFDTQTYIRQFFQASTPA